MVFLGFRAVSGRFRRFSGVEIDVVHWGAASRVYEVGRRWRQAVAMLRRGAARGLAPNEFIFNSAPRPKIGRFSDRFERFSSVFPRLSAIFLRFRAVSGGEQLPGRLAPGPGALLLLPKSQRLPARGRREPGAMAQRPAAAGEHLGPAAAAEGGGLLGGAGRLRPGGRLAGGGERVAERLGPRARGWRGRISIGGSHVRGRF